MFETTCTNRINQFASATDILARENAGDEANCTWGCSPKYLAELRGPKARVQPERRLCCRICRMTESNCLPLHCRFCNVSMLSA